MKSNEGSSPWNYDYLGIFFSLLCGVHCIITPILLLSLPNLGYFFESPWVHSALIAVVGLSFYQSIYKFYRRNGSKRIFLLGLTGFLVLLISFFIEIFSHHDHGHEHAHAHGGHHEGEAFLIAFTILGSVLLISSHFLNLSKFRKIKGQ